MKKLKQIIIILGIITGFSMVAMPTVGAVDIYQGCTGTETNALCGSKGDDANKFIKTLVDTLLFILGAISVLVIIIAGIMYATSGGEAANIKRAKDMLMYAIIGLVVALLAYAIVNFVLTQIGK